MKIQKLRKTNKNLKRVKFVKGLLAFLAVDLVLLGIVVWRVFYGYHSLSEEDLYSATGVVSYAYQEGIGHNSDTLCIGICGYEKDFYYLAGLYSVNDVDKQIDKGDFVEIRYEREFTVRGMENYITDLYCEDVPYVTFNVYNSEVRETGINGIWFAYFLLNILIGGGVFLHVLYYKNIERIFD